MASCKASRGKNTAHLLLGSVAPEIKCRRGMQYKGSCITKAHCHSTYTAVVCYWTAQGKVTDARF